MTEKDKENRTLLDEMLIVPVRCVFYARILWIGVVAGLIYLATVI